MTDRDSQTIDDYPQGTVIAIVHPPFDEEHGEREWFVRLPEHLIPEDARGEWQSLADGETWALDPYAAHAVIAFPLIPRPEVI